MSKNNPFCSNFDKNVVYFKRNCLKTKGKCYMEMMRPINVLLVEDDLEDCMKMKNYINSREEVKLIGIADSTSKALEYIRTHIPDAIILDIELNNGKGSGLEILEKMKTINLRLNPVVIVTTNISSKTVYSYAHENGADLIFHKLKDDYSPELVINNILLLSKVKHLDKINRDDLKTENDYKEKASTIINRELDLIGMSHRLVGRKYIHDAIIYILENGEENENAFLHLAKIYKKGNSTIGRSVQIAIEHAWRNTSIDDLEKYYTANVNHNTGVPTPMGLIYYYVDKVRKTIN